MIADLLIRNGANLNLTTIHGRTPLMWAAINGNAKMVLFICHRCNN